MYTNHRLLTTFCFATAALVRAPVLSPAPDYLVWVASEATDRIALVRFNAASGARVEREFTIGLLPTDPDGPHGLAVSPDGRYLFITTAHGQPFGFLWKIDAATGRVAGRVELGYFPATLQLTPDGAYAYVVNFNLHGDMVPSSVSVVPSWPCDFFYGACRRGVGFQSCHGAGRTGILPHTGLDWAGTIEMQSRPLAGFAPVSREDGSH